jgi:membrane protein
LHVLSRESSGTRGAPAQIEGDASAAAEPARPTCDDDGPKSLSRWPRRVGGSWLEEVAVRLKALDAFNSIVVFGAAFLLSALPLVIISSALAQERVDDDLSRHIGVDRRGAAIIADLFRKRPTQSAGPIVLSLLVAVAGTMAVVKSLQVTYEDVFEQSHRGWRDLPRFGVWVTVLLGALVTEGHFGGPLRSAAGPVARGLVSFALITVFFLWSMHFLLVGRMTWRSLVRPALVSSVLWVGLTIVSSVYFSSAVITEHRLFGTIGVGPPV